MSGLGGVHSLELCGMKMIVVSSLGSVRPLNLSGCNNNPDVSGLGGVHTLPLKTLNRITGVSSLRGVRLSVCPKLTGGVEWRR